MTEPEIIIARPGSSKIGSTQSSGDSCLRQLLALHEIASKAPASSTLVEHFMERNGQLLSSVERQHVIDGLTRYIEAFQTVCDYTAGAIGTFDPIAASLPAGEPGVYLSTLMQELAFRGTVDHGEMINQSLLTAAVSAVEVLFGDLGRAIYQRNPAALRKSGFEFTLEELEEYQSIEEARQALIMRRVDALVKPGVHSWAEWLRKAVGVDLTKLTDDWPRIREIFARRNAVVHANCRVDARYLHELDQAGVSTAGLSTGQSLKVAKVYLCDALERLIGLSLLMTHTVQARLYRAEYNDSISWVSSRQGILARWELWTATLMIAEYLTSTDCQPDLSLDAQVHLWLARKSIDGLGAIANEVAGWDIGELSDRYRMIKALLLDDKGVAADLVAREIREGRLTRFEVANHPLYANYRTSEAT